MVIDKKNIIKILFGYAVFLILMFLIFGLEGALHYLFAYSFLGLIALIIINTMTSSSGKEDKRFKSGYSEGPKKGILEGNELLLYPIIFLFANIAVSMIIALIMNQGKL